MLTAQAPVDVPSDAEYAYYDMGLCGPFSPLGSDVNARPIFAATTSLCGLFKVPTLRNIAVTAPYFHNGVFSTLRQVVEWYVTRDINNNPGNNPNPVSAGPGGNPYRCRPAASICSRMGRRTCTNTTIYLFCTTRM